MNKTVLVELASFKGKIVEVLDDQLHFLIHEGQVDYAQAVDALKTAGLALDKRFYPWLKDIEKADGALDPASAPAKKAPKPEIADLPDPVPAFPVTAAAKEEANEAPAEAPDSPEGDH
jgi:hypothetical protein